MAFELLSGHYYKGLVYEYDSDIENYIEPPKQVRFRPHDYSNRDIGANVNTETSVQQLQGYSLQTYSMAVQIYDNIKVETGYKFKDLTDGQTYIVKKVARGYDSIKGITNLMFPSINNRPKILFLGDISG